MSFRPPMVSSPASHVPGRTLTPLRAKLFCRHQAVQDHADYCTEKRQVQFVAPRPELGPECGCIARLSAQGHRSLQ